MLKSISFLGSDLFEGLNNLTELDLGKNNFRHITADLLSSLASLASLEQLALYESNWRCTKATHSPSPRTPSRVSVTWKDFRSDLTRSASWDVTCFGALDTLVSLSFRRSSVRKIVPGAFADLTTLRYLELGGNKLRELRADMFRGLESLTELYLYDNKFTTIDAAVFADLPRPLVLDITHNLLLCDSRCVFTGGAHVHRMSAWICTMHFQQCLNPSFHKYFIFEQNFPCLLFQPKKVWK